MKSEESESEEETGSEEESEEEKRTGAKAKEQAKTEAKGKTERKTEAKKGVFLHIQYFGLEGPLLWKKYIHNFIAIGGHL